MSPSLAIVAAGWAFTTYFFIRVILALDSHHSAVVDNLLNRIQAPEHAVAQALVKDEEYETMILPHTEESYWATIHHKDAE